MILIEVQTGSYLGEDDIIRHADAYARALRRLPPLRVLTLGGHFRERSGVRFGTSGVRGLVS